MSMYKQYIYLSDIALDFSYNPIYPPFKSSTIKINKWIDQIIPVCNNIITKDIVYYLQSIDLSIHNIKSILHLLNKGLIYRNSISNDIIGVIFWTSTRTTMNIIYSYANNEDIYNIIINDIETYAASIYIHTINILGNTGIYFNIINNIDNITESILYKICHNNYIIKDQIFSKNIIPNNKYYNINQYRYIHKELINR